MFLGSAGDDAQGEGQARTTRQQIGDGFGFLGQSVRAESGAEQVARVGLG